MKNRKKHNNSNRSYSNNSKNKDGLRLATAILISIMPMIIYWSLQYLFYRNSVSNDILYFKPTGYRYSLCVVSIILMLFLMSYVLLIELKSIYKRIFNTVLIALCVLFFVPFFFLSKGTYADDKSIKYTDVFGNTKKELSYSDVVSCECWEGVGKNEVGVVFLLKFSSGEEVCIEQGKMWDYPNFDGSANMVEFNKILCKYCIPTWDEPCLHRSLFDTDDDYEYFANYSKLHLT